MRRYHFSSKADQVANLMRDRIMEGYWKEHMPGRKRLAEQLGVSGNTVEEALQRLLQDGLLLSEGQGKRRRIVLPTLPLPPQNLRVVLLVYEPADRQLGMIQELQYRLREMGHDARLSRKCLVDLGMQVCRVARFVEQTPADAWIVIAGSRPVLEWFAEQPTPAFALCGRRRQVSIAGVGPDLWPALQSMLTRLMALGHRRISMLAREERRKPQPGVVEQAYLDELTKHGIGVGPYNLPDWKETREGYRAALDSLFRHTPPTALIIDSVSLFIATQQYLDLHGISVPRDVSLVCLESGDYFAWCTPSVAQVISKPDALVPPVVRWVEDLKRGHHSRRQTDTRSTFVEGGTMGPVPA